jgi:hypothetical protein
MLEIQDLKVSSEAQVGTPLFCGPVVFSRHYFVQRNKHMFSVPSMGQLSLVKIRLFGVYSTTGNMVGKAMAVHPQTLVAIC